MKNEFPQSVVACLWSYDTDKIDLTLPKHRELLVHNILNKGTYDAILWLMKNFSKAEIIEVILNSNLSDWSRKSITLWSVVFRVKPSKTDRFA